MWLRCWPVFIKIKKCKSCCEKISQSTVRAQKSDECRCSVLLTGRPLSEWHGTSSGWARRSRLHVYCLRIYWASSREQAMRSGPPTREVGLDWGPTALHRKGTNWYAVKCYTGPRYCGLLWTRLWTSGSHKRLQFVTSWATSSFSKRTVFHVVSIIEISLK
jgi:hypothetical protein